MLENIFCAIQVIKNELDPNADPLELLKDGSNDVDETTKAFLQNIYQIIQVLFVAGIAFTFEIALIKFVFATCGTTLEELKKEVSFKIGLIILFFGLVFIINLVVEAIKAIL